MVIMTNAVHSQENLNITDIYDKVFSIEKKTRADKEYLSVNINELDESNDFSALINNNILYIDYLLTNFSDYTQHEAFYNIENEKQLQYEFIDYLQNDKKFNKTMRKFAATITDKDQHTPDTVTMDEMLDIAVKFFYIQKINAEGYYVTRMCSGINGIEETEADRKPHVEAFCASVIIYNYESKEYNTYDELVNGVKDVYKLNLGTDEDEKLLRAQGAMYMYMRHNEKLKDLLIAEYQRKEKHLPFILKTE